MQTCFHSHFNANLYASVTLLFLIGYFHQNVEARHHFGKFLLIQGFFQPFWEGAVGPFALGNFRHFNRNWENFFVHFCIIFLNRDPKTALNHSYS